MPRQPSTKIMSIFSQSAAAAADHMIGKGLMTRIEIKDFPGNVPLRNKAGTPVRFAVIVPRQHLRQFAELIKKLRA